MELDNPPASRSLMETIHVLRDDSRHGTQLFELGEGMVSAVRTSRRKPRPPHCAP